MAAEIHSRPQSSRPVLLSKIEGHQDAVSAALVIPKEDGIITASEDRWGSGGGGKEAFRRGSRGVGRRFFPFSFSEERALGKTRCARHNNKKKKEQLTHVQMLRFLSCFANGSLLRRDLPFLAKRHATHPLLGDGPSLLAIAPLPIWVDYQSHHSRPGEPKEHAG